MNEKPKKIEIVEAINPLFCPFCGEDLSNQELIDDSNHSVSRVKNSITIQCPIHNKDAKIEDP